MKSSSGEHYIALDHVRALAAFMVVAWHFLHASHGYPVSFEYVPAFFPLALLDEGHTGVALFMTLSGYLFAKLLDERSIEYPTFLWNRALRLLPLLGLVITLIAMKKIATGESLADFLGTVTGGILYPTLPNGGWSITVECHYYLLLPILLWMLRRSPFLPLTVVAAAIFLRLILYWERGEIQSLSYWTIVGRIDQFALGMILYRLRGRITSRHVLAGAVLTGFAVFYWLFDLLGGFYRNPGYPSPSALWIFLPTIEGCAYAVGIAWYETSFAHPTSGASKLAGQVGELSYSIYLLHYFIVFRAAAFVHERIMDISAFHLALLWAAAFFAFMIPLAQLSYRFVEMPFLRLRRRYLLAHRHAAA